MSQSKQKFAHFFVWTEQNVTVGEFAMKRRHSSPQTTKATIPHGSLLVEASEMEKTAAPGSNVSLLSKMARSLPSVYVMNWSET